MIFIYSLLPEINQSYAGILKIKRESQTNRQEFQNALRTDPETIKIYFNTTEILNREALPLRQEYKQKVQAYFNKKND